MAMKLVKKTDTYSIFKRNDDRYAVQDANKNAINGDEKARILAEEELIKLTAPAAPEEVVAEEAPVEEEVAAEEEPAAEEAVEEAPAAEEPEAAEEAPAEEAPAEEAPAEKEEK